MKTCVSWNEILEEKQYFLEKLPNSRMLEQGGRNPSRFMPPKIINLDSNMQDE